MNLPPATRWQAKRYSPAWWLNRVLGRITADPLEQRNFFWVNIANVGFYGAYFLCQGELLWTYIAKCGFSNQQLGSIWMYQSLAGSIGMFLFVGWPDRFRRRLAAVAKTGLILLIQPLGIIALLLYYPAQTPQLPVLRAVIILCATNALIYSLTFLIELTVFVRTIRENTRGRVWGTMGVVAAIINILIFTHIARWAQGKLAPNIAVIICMAMGAGLWGLRAFSYLQLRELPDLSVPGGRKSVNPLRALWDIVRMKPCRALLYPQILRGVTGAMIVFVIPYAVKHLGTPATFGSQMALMGQVGLIAGNLMIALLRDRLGSGLVVFIGDSMAGAGFAFLIITHSWAWVLWVYALIMIGYNVEINTVPLGTFTIIPAQIMGAFSGVRMLLLGLSVALSSRFGGQLLDRVNPLGVFGVVAALKVVNGIWFWWVFTAYKPAPRGRAGPLGPPVGLGGPSGPALPRAAGPADNAADNVSFEGLPG